MSPQSNIQNCQHKLLSCLATEISDYLKERLHLLDECKQKVSIALLSKGILLCKAIPGKNVGYTEPEKIGKTLQFENNPLFSISSKCYFFLASHVFGNKCVCVSPSVLSN